MPLHREDRSVLRERARNQEPNPDIEAPELKQVNMMKRLANHIAENKHLAPRERDEVDEEIDYIPDGVNMLYDTYQMFKLPGRSDSYRKMSIETLNRILIRRGEEFIRVLAKENQLKQLSADLIRDVRNESNEGVKQVLCQVIGHLAEQQSDSWPELHRFINMNVTSNDASLRKTILELIGNWKSRIIKWIVVKDLIVESILGSDSTLWKPAIMSLKNFIAKESNEDREMMEMLYKQAGKECTPRKCEAIHSFAIDCLYTMSREVPRATRHHVERIITVCTKKIMNSIACRKWDDRMTALQMILAMSEHFAPSIPIDLIYDILASCLLIISENMNDMHEWSSYDGAIDKSKKTNDWAHSMGYYVETIATAIGKKKISSNLVTVTQEFLKNEKWEKRAAALIGWSVVGKNFRDGRVISLIDMALSVVCDTHPRVRYYAIYLIDLLFCRFDLNDDPDRFEKVLTSLISNLSDPIPRVVNATVGALYSLLTVFECPYKDILASNYDTVVPLLISIMEKWEPYEEICEFMSTNTIIILSHFACAAGKDRFKLHFKKVTSSIVVIFRSMEIFNVPLSIAINRICRVMGAECITLLRVISFKIDLKLVGHHFLTTLIKAVHTDNFDGSAAETIKVEQRVSHYVKKFSMDEESVERSKKSMNEGEMKTLERLLAYV